MDVPPSTSPAPIQPTPKHINQYHPHAFSQVHTQRHRDLKDLFGRFGVIERIDCRSADFAFVAFQDGQSAEAAIKATKGQHLRGRRLVVEPSPATASAGTSCA